MPHQRIERERTTSTVNTAAPTGVPKTAAKTPAIPARATVLRVLSSRPKTFEKNAAIPPPILRAAPSLPALPPKRWVITEQISTAGARRGETFFSV